MIILISCKLIKRISSIHCGLRIAMIDVTDVFALSFGRNKYILPVSVSFIANILFRLV